VIDLEKEQELFDYRRGQYPDFRDPEERPFAGKLVLDLHSWDFIALTAYLGIGNTSMSTIASKSEIS